MSNPIEQRRRELTEAESALEKIERKYYWLKGYGTGWKPEHYGLEPSEWKYAQDEHYALRSQCIALRKEIERLKKVARPGSGSSLLTHRGRP